MKSRNQQTGGTQPTWGTGGSSEQQQPQQGQTLQQPQQQQPRWQPQPAYFDPNSGGTQQTAPTTQAPTSHGYDARPPMQNNVSSQPSIQTTDIRSPTATHPTATTQSQARLQQEPQAPPPALTPPGPMAGVGAGYAMRGPINNDPNSIIPGPPPAPAHHGMPIDPGMIHAELYSYLIY